MFSHSNLFSFFLFFLISGNSMPYISCSKSGSVSGFLVLSHSFQNVQSCISNHSVPQITVSVVRQTAHNMHVACIASCIHVTKNSNNALTTAGFTPCRVVNKSYARATVDLVLLIMCNALGISITIFEHIIEQNRRGKRVYQTVVTPGRQGVSVTNNIQLIKRGFHYNYACINDNSSSPGNERPSWSSDGTNVETMADQLLSGDGSSEPGLDVITIDSETQTSDGSWCYMGKAKNKRSKTEDCSGTRKRKVNTPVQPPSTVNRFAPLASSTDDELSINIDHEQDQEAHVVGSESGDDVKLLSMPKRRKMKESRGIRKPVAHTPLSRPIQTSNIVYPVASSTDDEGWTNISDDERVYVQDSSSEDDIRLETAPMKAEPRHRRQQDVENKGAKKDIHYYHGDSSLPVYARPASGISTSKAVSIIIHDHPDPAQVATAIPVGINANALFVMDKDKVGHYKNALADSMGSWRQTGKEMHYVSYNKHMSTCQVVKYLPTDRKFRCSAKAFRVHYVCHEPTACYNCMCEARRKASSGESIVAIFSYMYA